MGGGGARKGGGRGRLSRSPGDGGAIGMFCARLDQIFATIISRTLMVHFVVASL